MIIKGFLGCNAFQAASLAHRSVFQPCLAACFRQAQFFSVKYNDRISSRIAYLFSASGPTTVFFKVSKRIVNTFNFMKHGWPQSHVGKKVFKYTPLCADPNASTAVMFKRRVGRTTRSCDHTLPTYVFWASTGTSAMPVFFSLSLQATARLCTRICKHVRRHYRFIAAFTDAFPRHSAKIYISSLHHLQSSEATTNEIDDTRSSCNVLFTSTRGRMPSFQIRRKNNGSFAAITQAMPSCFSSRRTFYSVTHRKFSEFLTGQIERFHMYSISHIAKGVQQWQS